MNLIEQLGGYEKAKAFLNATSFTIDELIMMQRSGLRTQHVEKALLEYRRQHNIFEVGDKVVDTDGFFDWLCKVDYLSTDGRVVMYKHDQRRGDTAFSTWPPIRRVRHATDAEIKAGKRLEVK